MKKNTVVIALLAAGIAVGTTAIAAEKQENKTEKAEVKKQTHCPVMGGKINPKQYVDVQGYRIYACCPGCKSKIKADPDKYIEKMKAEGITLEKAPKKADAKAKSHSEENEHSAHQH